MNSKEKGDLAVGQAIGYYTLKNFEVLLPIGDKKAYDFVVDDGEKLSKVQSKYSSYMKENGSFAVELRSTGGNQSRHTWSQYQKGDFDVLFIYLSNGDKYEIPFCVIEGKQSITVGKEYTEYKM